MFREIPPPALNGEKLYGRENSALQLAEELLNSTGNRRTPIMDHCFGAGKTSLVWKFRKIVSNSVEQKRLNAKAWEKLQSAVYLHVLFRSEGISSQFLREFGMMNIDQQNDALDRFIYKELISVLQTSSGGTVPYKNLDSLNDDRMFLKAIVDGSKVIFLFHFDDVGSFEGYPFGLPILYRMWFIGETLRSFGGHFFVLTGRSSFLHWIGKKIMFNGKPLYDSPNSTVLIPLDVLTSDSIRNIFYEKELPNLIDGENALEYVRLLTGGIPRAVTVLLRFVCAHKSMDLSDVNLEAYVSHNCPNLFARAFHEDTYRRLVEFAWMGIDFDPGTDLISGEFVTSAIARLGLYTSISTRDPRRRCVELSIFQLRNQNWSPRSFKSISEYDNPGARLETGFRRTLLLRLCLEQAPGVIKSWGNCGLPFLDNVKIPFPKERAEQSYPFPKIVDGLTMVVSEKDIDDCMQSIHSFVAPQKTVIPRRHLSSLCKLMKIGHYYQPVLMSGSADAKIRVSEKVMCDFQFKNFLNPISLKEAEAEVYKCAIPSTFFFKWNIYLIIVCTAGHAIEGGIKDVSIKIKKMNMTLIVLSKTSVEHFFGKNALKSIAYDTDLLTDAITRMNFSPLRKY